MKIREANQQAWAEELQQVNADSGKLWGVLKKLRGNRRQPPPNQPITFGNKTVTNHYSISKFFCRQFSSQRLHQTDRRTRKVHRRFEALSLNHAFSPFSEQDVVRAITSAKASTALGPDGLTTVHLKRMGPRAVQFLTSLFNHSIVSAPLEDS